MNFGTSEVSFSADTATDIIADACSAAFTQPIFNLLQIVDEELFLGSTTDDLDGTTADKRPAEISAALPFSKVSDDEDEE